METLASFWRRLGVGTRLRITQSNGYSHDSTITKMQTDSFAVDGKSSDKNDWSGTWYYKPKASECTVSDGKLEFDYGSTVEII